MHYHSADTMIPYNIFYSSLIDNKVHEISITNLYFKTENINQFTVELSATSIMYIQFCGLNIIIAVIILYHLMDWKGADTSTVSINKEAQS